MSARRTTVRLSAVAVAVGGSLFAAAVPAGAAPTQFTAGGLVVYEALGTSSAATAASLVDYSPSGTPSGYAVNLPTADSGTTHALTESGSALNDGELTLAGDGGSLLVSGYDAAPGLAKVTSATGVPRTVGIVSSTGTVDTSTALSDSTTEGNNFRSAALAATGGTLYTGSGSGLGTASDGATSATYLNADNVHDVQVVGGQLYESTTTGIEAVGSGLPTSASPTETPLVTQGGNGSPAAFEPDQFALVTLGSGTTPNTLYVADGADGAAPKSGSAGPNQVEKYSLENGAWTLTGTVAVPLAMGLVARVSNGVASVYVTGATTNANANNTVLYGITDGTGFGGTLTGTATTLATAPSGDDFHGLAFAPAATVSPTLPESPWAVVLPLCGVAVLLGGGFLLRRRRTLA